MKSRNYTIIFAKDSSKRNKIGSLISGNEQHRSLKNAIENHKEIVRLSYQSYNNGYSETEYFGCINGNIFAISLMGNPIRSTTKIHGISISHISKSKKQLEQISKESEFTSCKLMANFDYFGGRKK